MHFPELPPLSGYDGLDGMAYDPLHQTLTLWYSSADGTDDGPIRAVKLESLGVFWAKVMTEFPLPQYPNFLLHHGSLDRLSVEEGSPRIRTTEPGGKFTVVVDEDLWSFTVDLGAPAQCAHFKVIGNYFAAEWLCSRYSVVTATLSRDEFYKGDWISDGRDAAPARPAGLLLEAMNDLRLAVTDLPDDLAVQRVAGGSSVAWLAGHVTQMLESFVCHRFMRQPRDEILRDPNLGAGGSGVVEDWRVMRGKVIETHQLVSPWLEALTNGDMSRSVAYDGSIRILQGRELNLEYALLRTAAHHFAHVGEITSIRSVQGSPLPENRDWGTSFL